MVNKHAAEFDKLLNTYKGNRGHLLDQAANMAVAFFKENFRRQGFLDRTNKPWKKRVPGTPDDKGRAIEMKTGALRRGIMKKSVSGSQAVIGVDPALKYAEIQNNGGKIPVTNKMRRFFWAMYYESANKLTYDVKTKKMHYTKANKAVNAQTQFWRNLALSKKTSLDIPARPFIGDSKTLEAQIVEYFETELTKLFTT